MKKRVLFLTLVLINLMVFQVFAGGVKEQKLKMISGFAENIPTTDAAKKFIELVQEKSDGNLLIDFIGPDAVRFLNN